MIDENWIYLGIAIGATGSLSYIISMFKGRAKPNRVTWALWALAPLVAFAAEVGEDVGVRSLFTLSVGLGSLVIFILSFFASQAHWDIKPRDYIFGGISVVGLILWLITGEGLIAILFAIVADAMAAMPTLIKSFIKPESEDGLAFLLVIPNAAIALLIIDEWSVANAAFPIYILSIVIIFSLLINLKLGPKIRVGFSS